jgi:3-isopropylmalate/(R)-2-methylmalate dehydratase large subunit
VRGFVRIISVIFTGALCAHAYSPRHPTYVYGVNTDAMISGQACTLGYTGEILGPYFLENFQEVVPKDSGQGGGFRWSWAATPTAAGSSREVAVVAHQGAGIELVVADSFQRIFQENMVYGGMPFTTDRRCSTAYKPAKRSTSRLRERAAAVLPRGRARRAACSRTAPRSPARSTPPTMRTRAARPMNIVEKIDRQRRGRGAGR